MFARNLGEKQFEFLKRLGLAKIGVVPALINTNLRDASLMHTITVANSK